MGVTLSSFCYRGPDHRPSPFRLLGGDGGHSNPKCSVRVLLFTDHAYPTRPPRTYWGGVSVPMGGSSAPCAMQATLGLHIASSPSLLGCKNAQTLRSYLTRGRYPSSARTGVLSCHRHHSIPRARGGLSGPPHMQSILSVLCCPPSFWARVAVAAGKGGCRNCTCLPDARDARAGVCARRRLCRRT